MKTETSVILALALVFGLALPRPGRAQGQPPSDSQQILQGLASSFGVPLRDLLIKRHDSEWRNLVSGFSGAFGVDGPMKTPVTIGRTTGFGWRDTRLSASLKYTPLGYWFVSGTVYHYLTPVNRRPWSPDFTYVVGYDDWHPYTLSLIYANYGGNRFDPLHATRGQRTDFGEGGLTLAWKLKVPAPIDRAVAMTRTGGLGMSVSYSWTPKYTNAQARSERWKQKLGLSVRSVLYKGLYATATVYAYPHRHQQQPWDPDFTYGFGYFDWHARTFSVQYNNYAGNRFPWRHGARSSFRDGSLSLTWSWSSGQ